MTSGSGFPAAEFQPSRLKIRSRRLSFVLAILWFAFMGSKKRPHLLFRVIFHSLIRVELHIAAFTDGESYRSALYDAEPAFAHRATQSITCCLAVHKQKVSCVVCS